MQTSTALLFDHAARFEIGNSLGSSVFVEAGAGSGKTHEMVARICAMVDGGVELRTLVAITFTEKAAGELRERIRKNLAADGDPALRGRALDQLDTAPIGTIHSFALRLISGNPIAAGVPPLVTVVDEMRSQIAFNQRWDAIVKRLFHNAELDKALQVLLGVGVSLDNMKGVARGLDANWDRLSNHQPASIHVPGLDAGPIIRQTQNLLALGVHCTNPASPLLAKGLAGVQAWLPTLVAAKDSGDLGLVLKALRNVHKTYLTGGAVGHWKIPVQDVRDAAAALLESIDEAVGALMVPAMNAVVAEMCASLHAEAKLRQQGGELEYHDLLILARDLLVGEDRHEVHAELRSRYRHVMLDEFQDTDPIQAEIAVRLASPEMCGVDGWEQLPIPAGRLFTVGDPKQSIYRFRRADISTYLQAKQRSAADPASQVVELVTNFRSTPAVLDWVNSAFSRLIQEKEGAQSSYTPLRPNPKRPELVDAGPAVSVLGRAGAEPGPNGKVTAAGIREQEAADVARTIHAALGNHGQPAWLKQAGEHQGFAESPLELRDICILLPTRTALPALEDALDAAGIEFRAEASSMVYATPEVHDLLLILRAAANHVDQAALVFALRSPWLGCGDDDLLTWKQAGGSWHVFSKAPEEQKYSPVGLAMAYLQKLSTGLAYRTPSETMEHILADRQMLEGATDSPRYRDVWRRLRFVVDQARAWSEATHGSVRDYLVWAAAQQEENAKVKEAVVPETDTQAVRIMTIHASKGLEFPMVVFAGGGSRPMGFTDSVVWDQDNAMQISFSKGIESPGYGDAKTAEVDVLAEERLRLLYVACTRAESHLVVSLYNNVSSSLSGILQSIDDADATPELVFAEEDSPSGVRAAEAGAEPVPTLAEWLVAREAWSAASQSASAVSVTELSKGGDSNGGQSSTQALGYDGTDDVEHPAYAGVLAEHGANLGTAFHKLLELSGLQTGDDLAALSVGVAATFGLSNALALESMARSALASEPLQRAAAREHWQELKIAVPHKDQVLEGIVDLLFRDDDGTLTIVDFKTDVSVTTERLESYWKQLRLYAEAVNLATGNRVREANLLFCRPESSQVLCRTLSQLGK